MNAGQLFHKALLLLDRSQYVRAEEILRISIASAEVEGDNITLCGALCVLGDLLYQQDKYEEAVPLLQRVLAFNEEDDVLDYELRRAKEILEDIASSSNQ